MKEINEEIKKECMNTLNAALKAAGKEEITEEQAAAKNVGNNGYSLGQQFHTTGKVGPVTTTINGTKSVYIGVETKEGIHLSLQKLMNISSMRGFSTTEKAINETRKSKNAQEVEAKEVTPEIIEEFDFAEVFQPETRNLYDFYAYCVENKVFLNKTITYLGTVVRQLEAKKDSPAGNFELYKKGDKRAMSAPLFKVE